jgi:hypothetical protein
MGIVQSNAENACASWRALLFVFCIAFFFQFVGMDKNVILYDEGIILVGAERVLHGELPYKDFWTMYGPGQFYLTAVLFHVFDVSDLVLRVSGIFFKSLIVCLCYVMSARFMARKYAAAIAYVVIGLLVSVRNDGFPVFPAVALAMASILACELALRRSNNWLVVAGLFTGVGCTFRHDLGAYNAAAVTLVLLMLVLLSRSLSNWRASCWLAIQQIALYGLGIAVVMVPVAVFFLCAVPTHDLYFNLISIPANIYPKARALPFPALVDLFSAPKVMQALPAYAVYAPFLTVLLVSAIEMVYVRQRRNQGVSLVALIQSGWGLIPLLIVVDMLFIIKGLVRVSTIHMAQSLVISAVLLAIASTRMKLLPKPGTMLCVPLVILGFVLIIAPGHSGTRAIVKSIRAHIGGASDSLFNRCAHPVLPRLRCVSAEAEYLDAGRYIDERTASGDVIYVGSGRHDKIFINGVALYFMAARKPATRWHELHPGVQSMRTIQDEMVQELHAANYLVLDDQWDATIEPNDSRLANGAHVLDEYISNNFREEVRFGGVQVMARRQGSSTSNNDVQPAR